MIRRDHNKGYNWDHSAPETQGGLIDALIKKESTVDGVINEFKRSLPNYKGNHRKRVLVHLNHLTREHDDFPFKILDGNIIKN
jgi:hypothetical protein